jgi:hypothetical protein
MKLLGNEPKALQKDTFNLTLLCKRLQCIDFITQQVAKSKNTEKPVCNHAISGMVCEHAYVRARWEDNITLKLFLSRIIYEWHWCIMRSLCFFFYMKDRADLSPPVVTDVNEDEQLPRSKGTYLCTEEGMTFM